MSSEPHILIVEDDREIRALVTRLLRANGYRVSAAGDGREMEHVLNGARIDLILLDIMLPGEDGLSLCRRLRSQSFMPIIVLSAKGEEIDRVLGLEMGADDYVAKPFNPRELLARIKAVLRRTGARSNEDEPLGASEYRFCGWRMDTIKRKVFDPSGAVIAITDAEFDLLRVLLSRTQRILSRDQLMDLTQGRAAGPTERSIDILVARLRRKMSQDSLDPDFIRTVRSGGYMFTLPVESAGTAP
jgi:two-component system OmpR family response regulator